MSAQCSNTYSFNIASQVVLTMLYCGTCLVVLKYHQRTSTSSKLLVVLAGAVIFSAPSGPVTILLFFPRLLHVLEWGLFFNERRGLATTGHFSSTARLSLLARSASLGRSDKFLLVLVRKVILGSWSRRDHDHDRYYMRILLLPILSRGFQISNSLCCAMLWFFYL
jgi:hypothetical protein